MADNAATNAAGEEIKKEPDRAESNDEAFVNVIQSMRAVTESVHERNEDSPKSGQTSEEVVSAEKMAEIRKNQIKLLGCLPGLSASEDKIIIQQLLSTAIRFPDVRTLFRYTGAINQILNPTTVLRSRSDDALQCYMVELVFAIAYFNNYDKILDSCPGVMPFLVIRLTRQIAETRSTALRALYWLSLVDGSRKEIGESGAMKPLVEIIKGKDLEEFGLAASVVFNLCKVVENGERAVSEGVVIAVMDNIRSGVLVNQMLEILEVLSGHETAVVQMEENGVVECLFGILGKKDVKMEDKELCVSIFRAMCGDDVAKTRKLLNEVENARDILERVASSGTAKAKEKASELLSKLDSAENLLADFLDRMNIESK